MASFTTSNVSTNLVGRELSIASSFVKQYYTLLNKAPCFIHNFYSHDSTFIHGTLEMANEHYTEPVVGREKIKRKMEDLKLNDCRAKIKQIDCLETLAGGLVIQVIGELSNNGKPMRRFLQTFVLAPSPDESRQEGDSHHGRAGAPSDRRGVQSNENNSPSYNQKFFVLNSIFRYQDDGPESEFEDDSNVRANMSSDSANGGIEMNKVDTAPKLIPSNMDVGNSNGSGSDYPMSRRRPAEPVNRNVEDVEVLASNLEEGVKLNKQNVPENELERESSNVKVVSNGTGNKDKKSEVSEKSTENGKNADQSLNITSSSSGSFATNHPVPAATVSRPQPSNEPKTWANMVRNAPSTSIQINVNKTVAATEQQQHNVTQTAPVVSQQQPQQQQSQQQQQQQQQHHQQQQQQLPPPQQQNSQNSNRRRHMVRKPPNKSNGRSMKSRENRPRPPLGKPAA